MIESIKNSIKMYPVLAYPLRVIHDLTIKRYMANERNKIFLKNGQDIIEKLDSVFKNLDIKYWLEYGTLLGAVRDGDFIGHDLDIDIGLFLDDYIPDIESKLIEAGFKKTRKIYIDNEYEYGLEESYQYKGVDVDLFYFRRSDDKLITHSFKNIDGKNWKETIESIGGLIVAEFEYYDYGLDEIEFLGKIYPCPKFPEKHLKEHYGDNYMVPDENWNPYKSALNIKILDNKIGKLIEYK